MSKPIWLYVGYLSTPICCPSVDRLLAYLAQVPEKAGVIALVEGQARYNVPARVIYALTQDIVKHGDCVVSICGEGVLIDDSDSLIDLFRKVNTERLYVDGGAIKSTATTYETAYRSV